jgi:hypothetical protein
MPLRFGMVRHGPTDRARARARRGRLDSVIVWLQISDADQQPNKVYHYVKFLYRNGYSVVPRLGVL